MPRDSAPPTALAPHAVLVSHNIWLIPFSGAWNLGRTERVTDGLAASVHNCAAQCKETLAEDAPPPLVIVAMQEAWAYRVGTFWPIVWLLGVFEALLLRFGLVSGRKENFLYKQLKSLFFLVVVACGLIGQSWTPVLRNVLWDPKPRMAKWLKERAGLVWSLDGVRAFDTMPPWMWPICLMDSGLMLSASQKADEGGFVGYSRDKGSAERIALKGLLWARWGSLAVVNTHMIFNSFADKGAQRQRQQAALASVVAALLGVEQPPTATAALFEAEHGLATIPPSSRGAVEAVLVLGDLNLCLAEQITSGAPYDKPPQGDGGATGPYRYPWLPAQCSLAGCVDALRLGGAASVERLSQDAPTNEDGTIDHMLVVTKAAAPATYEAVKRAVVADPKAEVSDHLKITSILQLASRAALPAPHKPLCDVRCGVDHLVYTCAKLEDGIKQVERRTGVKAILGGKHLGIGTHNALLSLGKDVYLEIIAPDPEQPEPKAARPFYLDDKRTHNRIVAYAVHPLPTAVHAGSLEVLAAAMQAQGEAPGEIKPMTRTKPDGTELSWRLTPLARAAGPRPWLIDWGATPSPATTSPAGCSLVGLTCHGAEGEAMGRLMHETMGLLPLVVAGGGAPGGSKQQHVQFVQQHRSAPPGYLVAELQTPRGKVRLGD